MENVVVLRQSDALDFYVGDSIAISTSFWTGRRWMDANEAPATRWQGFKLRWFPRWMLRLWPVKTRREAPMVVTAVDREAGAITVAASTDPIWARFGREVHRAESQAGLEHQHPGARFWLHIEPTEILVRCDCGMVAKVPRGSGRG